MLHFLIRLRMEANKGMSWHNYGRKLHSASLGWSHN